MIALITVEDGLHAAITSSNVGVNYEMVKKGSHEYTFDQAREIIEHLDTLMTTCSKRIYPRLRSTRNQFVTAFGPDMVDLFGFRR